MKKILSNLVTKESGQGMVEYDLIIVLVAVIANCSLLILGPKIVDVFANISNSL